jgi:hypothetical protein
LFVEVVGWLRLVGWLEALGGWRLLADDEWVGLPNPSNKTWAKKKQKHRISDLTKETTWPITIVAAVSLLL